MKKCPKCKLTKQFVEFYRNVNTTTGFRSWCKNCEKENADRWRKENRERWNELAKRGRDRGHGLKTKYGLRLGEYEEILARQNGVCAICKTIETATLRGEIRRFSVDHDHITGKVRGLLCNDCNLGIGRLKDDPKLLLAALLYLEEHSG